MIFQETGGLNDSVFGKSQEPIKMLLEAREEACTKTSIVEEIFSKEKSQNFAEKYTSMTAMNGFSPVNEGGESPEDSMQEGYSKVIENVTWKDKFIITQEIIEDNKTIDLKRKPSAFVNGYFSTKERFGAAILGTATAADELTFKTKEFSLTGADGKSIFAIDHPCKVSGLAQSNKFTDAFSIEALDRAESKMQNLRGDNGDILAVRPDTIIIPNDPILKRKVFAAVGADKDPDGAGNGFNYQFGRWNVIVWAYLNQFMTATSGVLPWFMMSQDYSETSPSLIWQDRIDLTVKSYIDEKTGNNVWDGRARFNAGFNDFRGIMALGCAEGSSLAG